MRQIFGGGRTYGRGDKPCIYEEAFFDLCGFKSQIHLRGFTNESYWIGSGFIVRRAEFDQTKWFP